MIEQSTQLVFEDSSHLALHAVLIGHRFSFRVDHERRVGRLYIDQKRRLEVELAEGDGELRATIRNLSKPVGAQVTTEDDYTEIEQYWLEGAVSEADYLTRELHILAKVRPQRMRRPPEGEF